MINSTPDLAMSHAMSAQEYTNKKCKITFHTAEGDKILTTQDIQQQVEDFNLYRDKNNSVDESSSSDSSKSNSS